MRDDPSSVRRLHGGHASPAGTEASVSRHGDFSRGRERAF